MNPEPTKTHLAPEAIEKYLASLKLRCGPGSTADDICVMQAVDFVASGGMSAEPKCASPTITAFMIKLNDCLNNERRQSLKRFIPLLVSTRGTPAQERRREFMLRDWAVRRLAPTWFELGGFGIAAQKLRDLPEVLDAESKRVAVDALRVLRSECWPNLPYYSWYSNVYEAVRVSVEKELKKPKPAVAAAVAVAVDAVAVDDAAAVAVAAAAVVAVAAAVAVDAVAAVDVAVAAVDAAAAVDAVAVAAAVAAVAVVVDAVVVDAAAAAAVAVAAKYGTAAYWAWRDNLRAKVRSAVRVRLAPHLGSAIERNMVLVEELIEGLIAVTENDPARACRAKEPS
jgi:hypothetical protein